MLERALYRGGGQSNGKLLRQRFQTEDNWESESTPLAAIKITVISIYSKQKENHHITAVTARWSKDTITQH